MADEDKPTQDEIDALPPDHPMKKTLEEKAEDDDEEEEDENHK